MGAVLKLNDRDLGVVEMSNEELVNVEGGVAPILVAAAIVGGGFVAGLAVGALAAWAVYEITH